MVSLSGTIYLSMLLVTYMVDTAITNTFVIHSLNLPITIARVHDEEEVSIALVVTVRSQ